MPRVLTHRKIALAPATDRNRVEYMKKKSFVIRILTGFHVEKLKVVIAQYPVPSTSTRDSVYRFTLKILI